MASNKCSSVISISSPTSSSAIEPIVPDEDMDFDEDVDFAAESESSGEQWWVPENQLGLDPDRFHLESEDGRDDQVVALDKKGNT
jgi:hypothetical protein